MIILDALERQHVLVRGHKRRLRYWATSSQGLSSVSRCELWCRRRWVYLPPSKFLPVYRHLEAELDEALQ